MVETAIPTVVAPFGVADEKVRKNTLRRRHGGIVHVASSISRSCQITSCIWSTCNFCLSTQLVRPEPDNLSIARD